MAYRQSAARGGGVSRRLVVDDAFRWPKIVLGLVMLALGAFYLWTATWNSLECTGASCVLRQDHLLRGSEAFPFDTRNPPAVVVGPAKVGKNGQGKRLVLHYQSGADVELARDWGDGVEAKATRLRAYFATPRGSFALEQPHDLFLVGVMVFVVGLGLLMLFDGLTLLGWRRVATDGERKLLTVDWLVVGLRVKRETFPITPRTSVGRVPFRPGNDRIAWLTLEEAGAPAQRLPLLDRPKSRALIEEMLAGVS